MFIWNLINLYGVFKIYYYGNSYINRIFFTGGLICYLVFKISNRASANSIVQKANQEAEQIKKEKILQAKEKFIELKSNHEQLINKKIKKLILLSKE